MSKDHGHVIWNELNSPDPEKAMAFYGPIMGWTFSPMPMADGRPYWTISKDSAVVGGIFPLDPVEFAGVPPHWFTYFGVDDVDQRATEAVAAGGTIVRPAFDVPGVGRIAVVQDAEGAYQAWMTPVG